MTNSQVQFTGMQPSGPRDSNSSFVIRDSSIIIRKKGHEILIMGWGLAYLEVASKLA